MHCIKVVLLFSMVEDTRIRSLTSPKHKTVVIVDILKEIIVIPHCSGNNYIFSCYSRW